MLNDCEISPTNYMIAFLRQRGWHLPEVTMRIPNVIPEVDPIAAQVPVLLRIVHAAPCMAARKTALPEIDDPSMTPVTCQGWQQAVCGRSVVAQRYRREV